MANKQSNIKTPKCVTLDQNTIKKCEKYAEEHALSVSAVIRFVLNEFFNGVNQ